MAVSHSVCGMTEIDLSPQLETGAEKSMSVVRIAQKNNITLSRNSKMDSTRQRMGEMEKDDAPNRFGIWSEKYRN
uniref:Uncharacterized protein n=1 Tax=Angiostrongylus cantonensis TaxID=6313 RepID=A0A0K0DJ58_ANGCA